MKGTSETLREAGYTPSSPIRVRLRELKSLAQGHIAFKSAVAFKSSEVPQGRAFEEPLGAASMVIQVPWLISNRALWPALSWPSWEAELELVRSLREWMTGHPDWEGSSGDSGLGDHAERREGRAVLGAAPQDLSWDPAFSGERLSCGQDTCLPACWSAKPTN